jgi:hypothetical protein
LGEARLLSGGKNISMSNTVTLKELLDVVSRLGVEYYVAYTDDHIATINFWCSDTKKSVDNQGTSS